MTERADSTEIACSLERPPADHRDANARAHGPVVVVVLVKRPTKV